MFLEEIVQFFVWVYEWLIALMEWLGPLGFFFALVVQAIVAPIPSELMLFLGGAAYGPIVGGFVGGLGMTAGATVSFFISRKGGRPVVVRLAGEKSLAFADRWFEKWGAWAVLIGRFIPFILFDAISYGAGLTKMRFRDFIMASIIGGFPRSFFYAYLGYLATQQIGAGELETLFNIVSILIAVILVIMALGYYFTTKKYTEEESSENETETENTSVVTTKEN